jgi:hypothetical protein
LAWGVSIPASEEMHPSSLLHLITLQKELIELHDFGVVMLIILVEKAWSKYIIIISINRRYVITSVGVNHANMCFVPAASNYCPL